MKDTTKGFLALAAIVLILLWGHDSQQSSTREIQRRCLADQAACMEAAYK